MGPIYAASEAAIPGITSEKLVSELQNKYPKTKFISNLDQMKDLIAERKGKDLVFLTLGAGSISKKAKGIVQRLRPSRTSLTRFKKSILDLILI